MFVAAVDVFEEHEQRLGHSNPNEDDEQALRLLLVREQTLSVFGGAEVIRRRCQLVMTC